MVVTRFIFLAAVVGVCLAKIRYDGYKVLRVTPRDDFQLRSMATLKKNLEGKVDFWTEPHFVGKPVDLMVAPEGVESIRTMLFRQGLESSVMIEDVQKLDDETIVGQGEITSLDDFNYDVYHPFKEILQWIDDMAAEHSDIVSKEDLGVSYENRRLGLLKIGKPGPNKPIFWLMSGTHAREWLASASTLKIVDLLVTEYGKVPEITNLLDKVDFHVMPISNPDGFVYSHTNNRLWRKTRGKTGSVWCTGVDPNRNWDDHWNHDQSETYPCSEIYRGPKVFSEIEVKTVADYLLGLKPNVKVFIDLHAYSQLWLTPYGWTTNLPANYKDQKDLADKAVAALESVNGLKFEAGSTANVIYLAPASSIDWAYNKAGIEHCYTPEVRDKGQYGFLMPSKYIHPSAMEIYAAIKVIGNHIIP